MSDAINWQGAWNNRGNVLTTELNSLTSGSRSNAGSAVVDNSSNLDQYGKVTLSVTFGSAPAAGGYLALYAVTAVDGTNYEDGSSSADPGVHNMIAQIPVKATTSAQLLTSPIFEMQPAKTKFLLANVTNQSLPSSGTVVNLWTDNDTIN